jgi:hypothetical protein
MGMLIAGTAWAGAGKVSSSAPSSSSSVATHQAPPVTNDSALHVLRLPELTDALLQAKLDSISASIESNSDLSWDTTTIQDSTQKLKSAVQAGKYIDRATYDKTNFDHWKVDSALQENQKKPLIGNWRTNIQEHGHAFLDATLKFGKNDTLSSTTYTYTDSARYFQSSETKYKARYRFESDSTFRSRQAFPDLKVVRWDYVRYQVEGDTLKHHLYKLEFRDLMDNWLDAIQEFDRIPPEVYIRSKDAPASAAKPKNRS